MFLTNKSHIKRPRQLCISDIQDWMELMLEEMNVKIFIKSGEK